MHESPATHRSSGSSRFLGALLAVFMLSGPSPAATQCVDYSTYMHWTGGVATPGWAEDLAVRGDHAYIADQHGGFHVVDLTTAGGPAIVASVDTPGDPSDVALSGDYAYVTLGNFVGGAGASLEVIDVSTPESPVTVASVYTGYDLLGVAVAGNFAYVVGYSGLHAVHISNPLSPVLVGTYHYSSYLPYDIAVSGNHAYLAVGTNPWDQGPRESMLDVIDISMPGSPALVATVETPGWGLGVEVFGSHAYLAAGSAGLFAIDVGEPTTPTVVGSIDTPGTANQITVLGSSAYLADEGGGVQLLDVSTPETPQILGTYHPTLALGVAVSGAKTYIANGSGLEVVDNLATAEFAPFLGTADALGRARDLVISGDLAYLAHDSGFNGVSVMNVATPGNTQIVGSVATPEPAYDIAVSGNYAYVADGFAGLQVVDISTPETPVIVGSADTPDIAWGVAVSGSHAYVADWTSGLQIVDITAPDAPAVVAGLDTPGRAFGVTVSGSFAYVADETAGLQIVAIGTPEMPMIVGSVDTPHLARGVTVAGNHAYVADEHSGLQIVDITVPTSPVIVGSADTRRQAWNVVVAGNLAYVADGRGVHVVDVTFPVAPVLLGHSRDPASGLALHHGYVYVATGFASLQTLYPHCDSPTSVAVPASALAVALAAGRPNPFRHATAFPIHLDRAGHVELTVYNVHGRRVRALGDGFYPVGSHQIRWDGRTDAGTAVSAGVYYLRLTTPSTVATRRVIRLD